MNKIKFKTKLTGCLIQSDELKQFVGKEIEVRIQAANRKRKKSRTWSVLGSQQLGGKLERVNIRDFAYS